MSNSLWPHGLQHTRPPCPSPTPGAYSNSCSSSQSCHPTISSSVVPFSSHLQSFPASGSFQMTQFLSSGGQSIGVSASASVLPMNIQDWFPLGWTSLITLLSKGLSRVFSNTTVWKHQFFGAQTSLWPNSHIHTWLLKKTIALTIWTFVGKVMSLLFNMLSRFVIAFLPRSNCLLILSFTKDNKKEAQFWEPNNRICYSLHNFLLKIHWLSIVWFHYMLGFVNRAVGTSLSKKLKTGIKNSKLRKF